MAVRWRLTALLDGQAVEASWDTDGLRADPALFAACVDLVESGAVVSATPTGPSWIATLERPDAAWAVVRAVLDVVTGQAGPPPGYPWGVPDDAIC